MMKLHPECYTVPASKPFAKTLSAWVLESYGHEATFLPEILILLPNRRACRSLREAFLEQSEGKPLLLPRIQPIGDLTEEVAFSDIEELRTIPASMPAERRHMLLIRLITQFEKHFSIDQASELARQLISFMDEMARENVNFDNIEKLVPEELAAHWQQTLDFLKIISLHWPRILEEEGVIDAIDRRNRVLTAVACAWRKSPPDYPVIAAGSTGSQPATASLLKTIALMPKGKLVLHGMDNTMPDNEWDMVEQTHPQYGIRQLLQAIGCSKESVKEISQCASKERNQLLRNIFQSAEATAGWAGAALSQESISNLCLCTTDTQLEEARVIALVMREVLEEPEKTAALVTPDRTLARMVKAQMQRFDLAIDDSAGQSLLHTAPASFMLLAAEMVASRGAPVQLLSLLRHPLAGLQMDTAKCRSLSHSLEKELLRGVRRAPGLLCLQQATANEQVAQLIATLIVASEALDKHYQSRSVSFKQMLETHIACVEHMASTYEISGTERLWSGEAGNAMAAKLASLLEHADVMGEIDPQSYIETLKSMLLEETVRPSYGLHPRLSILSPIEARMQQYDLVILGGLNEGVWPSVDAASPWMSRPMKEQFGLPPSERAVGLSAHDMYVLCSAPEVLLTRAQKTEGKPTIPSRWLTRMKAFIGGIDSVLWEKMQRNKKYSYGVSLMDSPAIISALQEPAPRPPRDARPRRLSVSAIDHYVRDPYMIYARYILKLKALDPLDQDPGVADFGQFVHRALEQFVLKHPSKLPDNVNGELLECGRNSFAEFIDRPAVACLWWPGFEVIASWVSEQFANRQNNIAETLAEIKGEWEMSVNNRAFTLTTRIDRIEKRKDGVVAVIDYKTGSVPKKSEIERGLSNQLMLEALIIKNEGLETNVVTSAGIELEYWKLASNEKKCEVIPVKANIENTRKQIEQLLAHYDNEHTPYAPQTNPALRPQYNDYTHLTRYQEWEKV